MILWVMQRNMIAFTKSKRFIRYYHGGYSVETGTHFFVMEYFIGKDLAYLSRRPLPVFRALKTVRSVCKIVNDCHKLGFWVGDIADCNILMNADDQIKIIDIGFDG